jgi:hypothetical protein
MIQQTETIIDQEGIELIVSYEWEKGEPQIEECHGYHDVGGLVTCELLSVEVVIAGIGIEILPVLEEKQKRVIFDAISIW